MIGKEWGLWQPLDKANQHLFHSFTFICWHFTSPPACSFPAPWSCWLGSGAICRKTWEPSQSPAHTHGTIVLVFSNIVEISWVNLLATFNFFINIWRLEDPHLFTLFDSWWEGRKAPCSPCCKPGSENRWWCWPACQHRPAIYLCRQFAWSRKEEREMQEEGELRKWVRIEPFKMWEFYNFDFLKRFDITSL